MLAQRLAHGHQLPQAVRRVRPQVLEGGQRGLVDLQGQRRMRHQHAHDLQFQTHGHGTARLRRRAMRHGNGFRQLEQGFDLGWRGLRQLRQAPHDLQAQRRRRHQLQQGLGVELHAGAPFRFRQIMLARHFFQQELRQRHGFMHLLLKTLGAECADIAVRIVFRRQEQEFDGLIVRHMGQARFQRAAGGAAAGLVAIEAENHVIGLAQQFLHVGGRARRAQRGHRLRETHLRQRHHVHIPLRHQHVAGVADGLARLEQPI